MFRRTVLLLSKQINPQRAGIAIMRIATIVAVALFTTGGLNAAERADASITHYELNIPRQPLDTALNDLAQQTGLQVGRFSDAVKGDTVVGPVTGNYSADEALKTLLAPTGLTYRTLNERAIIVLRPEDAARLPAAKTLSDNSPVQVTGEVPAARAGEGSPEGHDNGKGESSEKSFWSRLRLAQSSNQTDHSVNNSPSVTSSQGSLEPANLAEVLVTAQKRNERLQDVPVPVTALGAQTLVENNQVRIQDYYTKVPGLNVASSEATGAPFVAIRGITTGGLTNPTVSIVVDDVPFSSSSALAWGYDIPDFDPSDLINVEVLRGPQGTLYGASSLGGLIKLVAVAPSTAALNGHVDVGFDGVQNGAQLGYTVRGAVNVPITDNLALRASAFTRLDPGYIDNVETAQDGVNKNISSGGRVAALWQPTDTVTLNLSALLQHSNREGSPYVEAAPPYPTFAAPLGNLQQSAVRGTGSLEKTLQAYSATLRAKFGSVDLTSVTGYSINKFTSSVDFTSFLGGVVESLFGVPGDPDVTAITNKKFTQEIRLSGWIGPQVEWLFGGFYDHEGANQDQYLYAAVPTTGFVVGTFLHDVDPSTYEEEAAFTDVTFHVTDRFDVQLGGREAEIRQDFQETYYGIYDEVFLGEPSPVVYPRAHSKENAFTYLVTPRLRISPDLMVYARLASGYRPGGPNVNAGSFGLPSTYHHDTTENYEVGLKGDAFEHALSFDASLYYIDWKNIQLSLFSASSGQNYNANGGSAKSEGLEISTEWKPIRNLEIAAWGAYNDAALTNPFPQASSAYGQPGDRLPYSSRFSGNLSVNYEHHIAGDSTGFIGGDVSYVGDRLGIFTGTTERQTFPSYVQMNLRAGGSYESWKGALYVNNVANKRGLIAGGIGTYFPDAFNYTQPRTIGITVSTTF